MRRPSEPAKLDPLTEAAAALAAELHAIEGFSESLGKEPLSSQKSLERAARLLGEAADADERLGLSARKLVEVIGEARTRQQSFTEAIQQRASEIQARTEALQGLLRRYEQLGQVAAQINQAVQRVAGVAKTPEVAEIQEVLPSLLQSVDQAVEAAAKLVEAAEKEQFSDVGRSADSLRQQLLAARNKMALLQQRLPTTH